MIFKISWAALYWNHIFPGRQGSAANKIPNHWISPTLIFNAFKILSDLNNGGTCFDNGGTQEFSCNCVGDWAGNECQTNLCASVDCQKGGSCVIEIIDGIRTPTCDCPPNTSGESCEISSCGSDLPCYNGACGGTENAICQCNQENGESKYHGESCDMPAACDGNPCQNGGTCSGITQGDETQVCFVVNLEHFLTVRLSYWQFGSVVERWIIALKIVIETIKDLWMFLCGWFWRTLLRTQGRSRSSSFHKHNNQRLWESVSR